ncbi:MAG: 30S ribosomal protein S12 methylthiotransferase RimO [Clostridiales bacterium]|nr:30S ribosomal protein S12 methylthiotransferase RimO [Clostridiales bacterium]
MKNVAVISLGCDKNRVDTEHILFRVVRGGYAVSDVADADVIIINTCAFIESARQESIDTILECAELKKSGKCKKLIVTGCLPQKHKDELIKELPEVDAFLGAFEYEKLKDILEFETDEIGNADENTFYSAENCGRLLTTYPHVAYLKIAEGCNNKCTFCTIPKIRGEYRSRPVDDILKEAESLVTDGVKELILVAQDVTRYGLDIGESLVSLLKKLSGLSANIRLLYCYPEQVTDELIELIATTPNIVKYIDIPVQHASDKILKLMNRRTTGSAIRTLVNKLHDNGIVVRTTLMVGFPGETQAEFDELCDFVNTCMPEYAGVFAYSKEDGTAAARLPDQVKKADKIKRVKTLGALCTAATREFNKSLVGKTIRVLYEDVDFDKNMFIGRADFQTPDVDGVVYFKANGVDVGNYYEVNIDGYDDYDLYGTAVGTDYIDEEIDQ